MNYKTEQENFWADDFGTHYSDRNVSDSLLRANMAFFVNLLRRTGPISSIIELGANIGMNVRVLNILLPDAEIHAVEINKQAAETLRQTCRATVHVETLLEFKPPRFFDLSFTKGVLIHIAPEALADAYKILYESSLRYVLLAEYYNPSPMSIAYRGHKNRLFKRDFAGEIMDRYPDLSLVDYGFLYHRDPNFPQDDITWFLMEKRSA